jgi:hypothetical protein
MVSANSTSWSPSFSRFILIANLPEGYVNHYRLKIHPRLAVARELAPATADSGDIGSYESAPPRGSVRPGVVHRRGARPRAEPSPARVASRGPWRAAEPRSGRWGDGVPLSWLWACQASVVVDSLSLHAKGERPSSRDAGPAFWEGPFGRNRKSWTSAVTVEGAREASRVSVSDPEPRPPCPRRRRRNRPARRVEVSIIAAATSGPPPSPAGPARVTGRWRWCRARAHVPRHTRRAGRPS